MKKQMMESSSPDQAQLILMKNSQKWLAISIGSVISLLSVIKEDCTLFILFLLLITSFNSLQVDFIFDLHSSNFFKNELNGLFEKVKAFVASGRRRNVVSSLLHALTQRQYGLLQAITLHAEERYGYILILVILLRGFSISSLR